VLMDLGAGVERTVRQLTVSAGQVIVVVTDEPTSLTDAYAFIKVIQAERPGLEFKVVANIVNSTREGERTYNTLLKACEGFLKISPPLLAWKSNVSRKFFKLRNLKLHWQLMPAPHLKSMTILTLVGILLSHLQFPKFWNACKKCLTMIMHFVRLRLQTKLYGMAKAIGIKTIRLKHSLA